MGFCLLVNVKMATKTKGFVSAGWVHDLSLHSFVTQSQRKYLVKAKVSHKLT